MNTALSIKDLKAEFVQQFENKQANYKFGSERRKEAIQHFRALGIPTTKHEDWKYVNLLPLSKIDFVPEVLSTIASPTELQPYLLAEKEAYTIVLLNGKYAPQFSTLPEITPKIIITSLAQAFEQHTELVEKHFAQIAFTEKEAFVALNTALAEDGLFIYIADNQVVHKPIIVYFITDAQQQAPQIQIRNLYVFGKNSQATILTKFDTLGNNANFSNLVEEIFLAPNAIVDYYKIQNENENTYHIGTTKVRQDTRSVFSSITVSFNGAIVRNNLDLDLQGEYCEGNMFGLYILKGKTLLDNHTSVNHALPNAQSNEFYKGVLDEKATGVFNGKIFVRQNAQKTNAYQQNRNILLSQDASINTKPQLEIWADDVKCSHGATVGNLDKGALFYLRSRGISEESAKALLVYAFANEIIEKVKVQSLKEYLEFLLSERLQITT
ncbi:MAG: Fe-S cluster assembly protein SufD [Microscillaceae bacterium]|nr:Fe-S cluster assembly protein SufD [Microscillaceae bacterium]MDW8461400.1 Fe-S cluster assembly protein SufD [Cytophagales bacterium]